MSFSLFEQGSRAEQARSKRIGIIGGTFDPVHYAHLAIAEEVYCELQLTRVVFVPAGQPPHKLEAYITPVRHRVAMLEQAIASNTHFSLSLVDVERPGPSYTVDMLRLLHHEWGPHTKFYFVLGSDSLKDLSIWHDISGILAQTMIVALVRPGHDDITQQRSRLIAQLPDLENRLITLEGPRMDISSTELRQRVAGRRPIKYQTPEPVETYIYQYHLYQENDQQQEQGQGDAHAHAADTI